MRLYNAGLHTSNFDLAGRVFAKLDPVEQQMRRDNKYFLESYHYIGKETAVKRIRNEGIKVFLDSGAFSAYTQGVTIDIGKYCDYCHRNADIIEVASVLDVIDFNDSAKSIKGTFNNLMEMRRRGVEALPCFHYGEPDEVLQYYVANYEYITLGGMVPISTPQLIIWLDRIWAMYMTNPDGTAKVKVHGFGLTSLPLMLRYPWYSVDSSTWVQWAANGMILIPGRAGQIDISNKSSRRKIRGQHIDSLAPIETAAVENEIRKWGGDPDRLRDLYTSRWAWNCWAFPKYVELRGGGVDKFTRDAIGLFDA